MKTELKVIIHHDAPLTKKQLQSCIKDGIHVLKGGCHESDYRRAIKRVTFKQSPPTFKSIEVSYLNKKIPEAVVHPCIYMTKKSKPILLIDHKTYEELIAGTGDLLPK